MRPSRIAPIVLVAVALAAAGGAAAANLHLLAPRQPASAPLVLDQATSSGTGTTLAPGDEPGEGPTAPPGTGTTTAETPVTAPTTTGAPASTVPSDTSPPATSPPPTTAPPPSSSGSYAVGDAGSVVLSVSGGRISVGTIRPSAGWTYAVVKQTGEEVEIAFQSGERQAGLHGKLEGGQLVVEIDDSSEPPDD